MMLLTPEGDTPLPVGCFRDHLDARLIHHLPDKLTTSDRGGGIPDFNLARYGGDGSRTTGGFLSGSFEIQRHDLAELKILAPDARWEPVDFESASMRLFVRSRTADAALQHGEWHPVPLSGNRRIRAASSLAQLDASLLAHLLSEGGETLELELLLRFRGLVSGIPGYAIVERERAAAHLRARFGARDPRCDEIVAAYQSLPDDGTISIHPLDRAEPVSSPRETLMEEIALRSLERVFDRANAEESPASALFRLRDFEAEEPGRFTVALHTPRIKQMEHRLFWSVSELHHALTDAESRAAHFSFVGEVSPFSEVRIPIANSLPFDPAFLRRVVVDVRFTGRSGILEHQTFRFPDDGALREIQTHFPSMNTSFALEARVRSLLSPPGGTGWPMAWPRDAPFENETSGWIEITPERARVRACAVSIDARAFERASRIVCTLRGKLDDGATVEVASAELLSGRESAAMVVPEPSDGSDLELVCVAFPPGGSSGESLTLVCVSPCPRHLAIPVHRLEVLDPDVVEARLPEESLRGIAFASIEFKRMSDPEAAAGALRTFPLEGAQPVVIWKTWRESVFASLSYLYRTHVVVSDDSGRHHPMQSGPWIEASQHLLDVEMPVHA